MLMFSAPRNRRRMALSNRLIRYSELKTPVKKAMKKFGKRFNVESKSLKFFALLSKEMINNDKN